MKRYSISKKVRDMQKEWAEEDKKHINQAIGELLIKEKYKFLPNGLIGEVCRDFFEEFKKAKVSGSEKTGSSKEGRKGK